MCINFINEKTRKFATNRLLIDEIEWYKTEKIDMPQIDFLDNQSVIGNDEIENETNLIISLNIT